MKLHHTSVAGPFTHENLSIFLLLGDDVFDGSRFLPLGEALEQKLVTVHETGQVGQLEVENLSEQFDLYIQAGDVVKGGQQDRTLGVDFVLPAKSGRVPVPSFCVEMGRWHRRAQEAAGSFASSQSSLSSKSLRMAAKLSRSQGEVWQGVAMMQECLSASLHADVADELSPTSFQLSVENQDVQKRKDAFRAALAKAIDDTPGAVGYAFVINGEINTADTYGSGVLFRKLWDKLLDAAVLEAIAESPRQPAAAANAVTADSIREWFAAAEKSEVTDQREVPPRVRMDTRRSEKSVLFETYDHGLNETVLHRNLIAH